MNRHEEASPAPLWRFGAPSLGMVCGLAVNWFLPNLVSLLLTTVIRVLGDDEPDPVRPYQARIVASLIGIMLAVGLLSIVRRSRGTMSWRRR
jgi:hypothetical protein